MKIFRRPTSASDLVFSKTALRHRSISQIGRGALKLENMFMQNFSCLASTQTDFDKFLAIFEENFRIFQENILANSKKFQT
jgi:hypothetical protein